MITVTPQGNVYLCKTPLENDYKNQLTFDDLESQLTYFNSTIDKTFENYTYMKIDNVIKVGVNIDEIINDNYLFYRNTGFTNKYYFCFITNKEYINENCTALTIETDVYQTYMFDIEYQNTFIEREHVDDDTVGKHTIPEGIETGDYICNSTTSLYSGGNACYTCVACTELPAEMQLNQRIVRYNGIFSGVFYVFFNTVITGSGHIDYLSAGNFIYAMDLLGKADSITSIFLVPYNIAGALTFTEYNISVKYPNGTTGTLSGYACVSPNSDTATDLGTVASITPPSSIDGYTPKNNKLFTYPYNYFYISNNVGNDVEFHYEDFVSNTAAFKTVGSITPGCSIKCFPLNYKKLADVTTGDSPTSYSYNYGVVGAKYPMCSWQSDPYLNWLTQNGINIAGISLNAKEVGIYGAIASGLASTAAMGFGGGGVAGVGLGLVNTAGDIMDVIVETNRRDLTPPSAKGNANSGDVTYSFGKMDIPLYKMTVRKEYAVMIDSYFQMYGYKVNEVKVPNIHTRTYWNYIKTIGCELGGNIPLEHIKMLKAIFDNGITFWHNPDYFLDYSQNNAIVPTPSL